MTAQGMINLNLFGCQKSATPLKLPFTSLFGTVPPQEVQRYTVWLFSRFDKYMSCSL